MLRKAKSLPSRKVPFIVNLQFLTDIAPPFGNWRTGITANSVNCIHSQPSSYHLNSCTGALMNAKHNWCQLCNQPTSKSWWTSCRRRPAVSYNVLIIIDVLWGWFSLQGLCHHQSRTYMVEHPAHSRIQNLEVTRNTQAADYNGR